ncbi:MAG: class I SAM-dependent methyltransferase [Gammaproteobacteria bacterium]
MPPPIIGAPGLPAPGQKEQEATRALTAALRLAATQEGGSLSMARFMEICLYEPQWGYYTSGRVKFGREGDFVTAPELTPLFARCIARQIVQVLEASDGEHILEIGAGSGLLAAELMNSLRELDRLPTGYYLFDLSEALREQQARTLQALIPDLFSRFVWLDRLPAPAISGAIIANEVLDALPVHCFSVEHGVIRERRVVWRGNGFGWRADALFPPSAEARIERLLRALPAPLENGYASEINLGLHAWFFTCYSSLARGALFCVDYGYPRAEYYHPQRHQGTLICHYRHRAHNDPLILLGLQDISSFVDFTAAADAACIAGFRLAGYASQAHFLLSCGIDQVLEHCQNRTPARYLRDAQQAKSLLLPGEMGERFKVLALTKNMEQPLLGFHLFDHRGRLV